MDRVKKSSSAAVRTNRTNILGLDKNDYKAKPTTLCKGCGHNSISQRIINATWELGIDQTQIIKLSGIGCSSKSPAYFLGQSHGFNSVHGRMPSVATGAMIANRNLTAIGVSGDGDTASIGIGQFKHAVRRNVPMVYIIENNGVYGLTKGQFSATADKGQSLKYAGINELPPLDICIEALTAGATFVARSFAGDARQVEMLLKAALSHHGIAVLDIISPCVTFNNQPSSTKSYDYGKANAVALQDLEFIPSFEEIEIEDYGDEVEVQMHDGSWILLKKIEEDHNPRDRTAAFVLLEKARHSDRLLTGLFYIDESQPDLVDLLHLVDTPLSSLPTEKLRPSRESLEDLMAAM
jgi:2-oxoglutarate/2-oxoacid ferredoxin oxidoreductase subunit beta